MPVPLVHFSRGKKAKMGMYLRRDAFTMQQALENTADGRRDLGTGKVVDY